jgi:arginyl-tRNA synthetase
MTDDLFDLNGLAVSLGAALAEVLVEAGGEVALPTVELTLPARAEHGDLTTNAAMVSAKRAKRPPRDLAQALGERWTAGPDGVVCDHFEVAGPGFLNLFLDDSWFHGALVRMLQEGPDYGRDALPVARRERINVEYVSANPVGPLHVGNARYGAMGDALCRVFAFVGHDATPEYYVNDAGTQMVLFGQTLAARYGQRLGVAAEVPDNGYQGDYVVDLAQRLIAEVGEKYRDAVEQAAPDMTLLPEDVVTDVKLWGRDRMLEGFRETLGRLRVRHDVWTNESSMYDGEGSHRGFRGEVAKALADLDSEGLLFEEEGAVWLRTTDYGDDKDRVLIRSTGEPTYFLSDIAYHRDKMDRGFLRMIDIWGADHHGYVPRMKAAFTALPPHDPQRLELIIGQFVNLVEGGEAKRMSKRKGDIVTVDDLVEAIGVDAARFLLVGRSHDVALDIDLDLAVQQSNQNPVYYVQYAHARICSILRNLGEAAKRPANDAPPAVTLTPHERSLIKMLARFPEVVLSAAAQRAPHRIVTYLGELAAEFHVFYKHCRVLTDDAEASRFRAGLCVATRSVLATGLGLLGVSAPESM